MDPVSDASGIGVDGVLVAPLREIADERGAVLHMLRADSPIFRRFGEIYFSEINPGAVKAWKRHRLMSQTFAVPAGRIRLVLYDDRPESKTNGELVELFIGEDNYCLVQIPPMVWNGWKAVGTKEAILANCPDLAHDPDEIMRKDPFSKDIPYDWSLKHR